MAGLSLDLVADRVDRNRDSIEDHEKRIRGLETKIAAWAGGAALLGSALGKVVVWVFQ